MLLEKHIKKCPGEITEGKRNSPRRVGVGGGGLQGGSARMGGL